MFDSTHSLGRVIGRINTGTTNGSYTYNGAVDGTFFAALMGATTGSPSLSTSGNTITWTFSNTFFAPQDSVVIFGSY